MILPIIIIVLLYLERELERERLRYQDSITRPAIDAMRASLECQRQLYLASRHHE